ncbi:MAG: leucine-rich repeat domain-containing protein [Syntrophomonadaceae bacterium]|jgi:hypothetical protein
MAKNASPNQVNENGNSTPVKAPFYKKRKFWKKAGILTGIAAGIAAIYAAAIELWLNDLSNLTYLRFSYRADPGLSLDQQEVTITKVLYNTNYPANFIIPKKILGRPVTKIGTEAFAGLKRLRRVEMPHTITTIDDRAFYNCPNLSSFEFSSAIDNIGVDAFTNTKFFNEFDDGFLYVGHTLYAYKGVLPNGTALIPFGEKDHPEYSAYPNVLEFDEEVESLAPGLFKNQPGLVSVYLPDAITVVAREVFANNNNLAKIVFGDNVCEIAAKAFYQTPKLTEVTIPNTVTSIGEQAFMFSGITGEVVIPEAITSLSNSTFEGASNITAITIGDEVTSIGERVFQGCTKLAAINIDHHSKITMIGREAFAKTALTTFTVPKKVTSILSGTFRENKHLTAVYVAEPFLAEGAVTQTGIGSLRDYAFFDTPNLKTFATYDTTAEELILTSPLNEVTLPNTVRDLGVQRNVGYVFAKSGIEKITLPDGISLLPTNIFENATNLANVTFGEGSRLTEIKQHAFRGTSSLSSITLPNTVRTIGHSAFQNSGLVSFTFPTLVVTINESLFENCDSLIDVTFPENLKTIKARAFFDCDAITTINLPATVTHLYEHSFGNCDNLIDVNFDAGMVLQFWNYAFAHSKLMTTATIPAGVTEVALGAFKDSPNITAIDWTLAPNITRINDFAFQNNTSLVNIDIPETVTSIGKDAFSGTGWYEAQQPADGFVILDHVLYRFKGELPADGILEIPAGVRVINEYCFAEARGQIKKVIIPASVEFIGKHAFANSQIELTPDEIASGLTGLGPKEIVFAENSHLKTIEDYAFLNATALEELILPVSLEMIGSYAFIHCTNMTTLEFPKGSSLKEIKNHAFYDTLALTGRVYIPLNAKLGNYAFGSVSGNPGLVICIENPFEDSFNTNIYNANWNPHKIPVEWGVAHP